GDTLGYAWTQTGGDGIALSDFTAVEPAFTPTVAGIYDFSLVVSDGILSSAPDTVSISVNPAVVPPVYVVAYTPPVMVSIAVTPESAVVEVGKTQQFAAVGRYSDGSTAEITAEVTWSSSDSVVVTIDHTGLAIAEAEGIAEITATLGGITSNSAILNATAAPVPQVVSIEVTPESSFVSVGDTRWFMAMGTYSDGSTAEITGNVTWSSSDTIVATIDESGLVTAEAEGTAEITATLDGTTSDSAILYVIVAPTRVLISIEIAPESAAVLVSETQQFTAMGTYSDGSTADITDDVNWSSSDVTVAVIDDAGLATVLAEGVADITASLEGIASDPAALNIGAPLAPVVVSIEVVPAGATIGVGGTQQFMATGTYSDGSMVGITAEVIWSSSDTTVASIDDSGLATGVTVGSVEVTARLGPITGGPSILTIAPAVPWVVIGAIIGGVFGAGTLFFVGWRRVKRRGTGVPTG
ncbi:MAG: Ig-like domain-containing protein, partial [Dehalococcoidia bacterium]